MLSRRLFLCVLCTLLIPSFSLYFLVGVDRKCFTIEQPRDTPVLFSYNILDSGHEVSFDLYYEATASPELQIMNKIFKEPAGKVDFTVDNDGYYSYCLTQIAETASKPTRLEFKVKYGYNEEHYNLLVKEHNFDTVNLQVHKLNDQLTMTLNEADYQKHKEVVYHDQTEKMNNAALWWPVVQIGILIITGVYQVQHLKSFFKSNKLI